MMNSLYLLSEVKLLIFSLIMIRMVTFVVASPVFGSPQVSASVKILLCLVMTLCLFPTITIDLKLYDGLANNIILLAAREALVGLVLGFLCRLFFYAVSMTGEMISISLGLNAGQLFNPLIGSPGNIIEQFFTVMGMLFFFMVNGHQMMIGGLVESFHLVKLGQATFNFAALGEVAGVVQGILVITVKLCAPVLVAILLSHVAMGLLGRAIPQINVLVSSFPVTIMVGLFVIIICMPLYLGGLNTMIEITADKMLQLMKSI